jgi:hypothetical protein
VWFFLACHADATRTLCGSPCAAATPVAAKDHCASPRAAALLWRARTAAPLPPRPAPPRSVLFARPQVPQIRREPWIPRQAAGSTRSSFRTNPPSGPATHRCCASRWCAWSGSTAPGRPCARRGCRWTSCRTGFPARTRRAPGRSSQRSPSTPGARCTMCTVPTRRGRWTPPTPRPWGCWRRWCRSGCFRGTRCARASGSRCTFHPASGCRSRATRSTRARPSSACWARRRKATSRPPCTASTCWVRRAGRPRLGGSRASRRPLPAGAAGG